MASHTFYSLETIIIFMVVSVYSMCLPTLRKHTWKVVIN